MHHPRPDRNRKQIVAAARQLGCLWINADRWAGHDGILITRSGVFLCEIKVLYDSTFTPSEIKLKEQVTHLGQVYHVLRTVDDVIELAGF